VHRSRSGQLPQAAPKMTLRVGVISRVRPAGQVTAPACSSTVKSSMVNPPATAGCTGLGLITAWCPAWPIASRRSPVP
jgi:hypothetical protein